jgi:phosphoadenosine phosphosulfate reductase
MNENGSSSVPTFSADELRTISDGLESSEPQEILRWALMTFGDKLTMATAFGAEGCVIMDIMARLRDETGITPDIFNLDTGYQFQETLEMRDTMQERYGIPIRFVRAKESVRQMEARLGGSIYASNPTLCCYQRKVVPLREALQGFGAWVSAIRRDQTPERATQPIVGPEPKYDNLVKINPLANWTKDQVWDYVRANKCRPIRYTIRGIRLSAAIRALVPSAMVRTTAPVAGPVWKSASAACTSAPTAN